MNQDQQRLIDGFRALRDEPVPTSVRAWILTGLRPGRLAHRRWVTTFAIAALTMAIVVIIPVPALGSSLQGTLDAAAHSSRHRLRVYEVSQGRKRLVSEVVVCDGRLRMSGPGSADLFWESGSVTHNYGTHATVEPMQSMPEGAGFATLRHFKGKARSLLATLVEPGQGDLRIVEGVAAGGRTVVTIDRRTLRPILQVVVRPDGTEMRAEWSYDDVSPKETALNIRPGSPVFNQAVQREMVLRQSERGLATDGTVTLRALVAGVDGLLVALIDSDEPTPESAPVPLKVNGIAGTPESLGGLSPYENGQTMPIVLQGNSVSCVSARFVSIPDSIHTLQVGERVFRNVRPMLTGNVIFLLAPRNLPFWMDESEGVSGPTRPE